jgi:hypothetical protein
VQQIRARRELKRALQLKRSPRTDAAFVRVDIIEQCWAELQRSNDVAAPPQPPPSNDNHSAMDD